jgi:uncharacterized protein YndB with AHSA1/START domain
MKKQNFTTTILVDQTPGEVFDAVNNVRGWWSEEIEGSTDKPGAEFKFHYQDLHYSTHRITEFVPGKKVVWHVTDSRINFVKDKTEWNGTDVVFEIAKKGKKTELRFTHVGLVPAIECYGKCSGAWGYYINDSLRRLITTGKGEPEEKEPGEGTESSPGKSKFVYVTYIRTTPKKLWQALTDPKVIRQYFYATTHESQWKRGSSWTMRAPNGRVTDAGEVLESKPPRKLVLKWRCEMTKEHYAEGFSRMTYEVEKSGGSVKLTVTHEIDVADSKLIEGVSGGWPPILSSLKSLLETGESLVETRRWPKGL